MSLPDIITAGIPIESSPAAVYLARLGTAKSRASMRWALETVCALAGGSDVRVFPWHRLTYGHTQALRAMLAERYAPASANLMLSALRGVLEEAWRLGLMEAEAYRRASDLKNVRGTRVPKGRALNAGEIAALFAACTETPLGLRDRALLAILFGAGLRRAEAVGLDLADYDAGASALLVRGKGNKERVVYLNDGAVAHLAPWLTARGELAGPLLLPVNKAGRLVPRRLSGSAVRDILLRLATAAGVAPFAPHSTRRTYVTSLLDAGVDLHTVSLLAGHSQVSTTALYDRRGDRVKRQAARLLKLPPPDR